MNETLSDKAKRWNALAKSGATGPLVVCREIVEAVDNWSQYQKEAGTKNPNKFLRDHLGRGRGAGFWRKRVHALDVLGESIRRTLDHFAAVWVVRNVPADRTEEARDLLIKGCRLQNGVPLTYQQARLCARAMLGIKTQSRSWVCVRCAMLEGLLRMAGVAVPEEPIADAAE